MWRLEQLVALYGRRLSVGLAYPRCEENPNEVFIELVDVRAADGILIRYDFQRDGWVILQASRFEWEEDEEIDEDWQEVAFIQAWGRKGPSKSGAGVS